MNNPTYFVHSRLSLPRFIQFSATLGAIVAGSTAHAAVDYYKANNASNLNTNGSWVDINSAAIGTTPTNNSGAETDTWIWDNRVLAENIVKLGGDLRVKTIRIVDPQGAVTIDGDTSSKSISVGNGGGVDMSNASQNLLIKNLNTVNNTGFRLLSNSTAITINVKSGRTLTLESKIAVNSNSTSGTSKVDFTNGGTTICNAEVQVCTMNIAMGEVQLNSAGGSTRLPTTASTTVSTNGRLVVNNTTNSATGAGPVTINDTATLTGQGSMSGLVTINSGGTLIPRENAIGTINAGSLTLAAGSKIKWEGIDPTQADLINVTTNDGLTLNGGTISLFNASTTGAFSGTGVYKIFSYSGAIGGAGVSSLAVDESSKIPGQVYTFGVSGGFVTLTITVGDNRPKAYWNVNANGNWSTASNWTGSVAPNAQTFVANLGGALGTPITQPRTVTLNSPSTVGTLNFDSAQPFTLAGATTLTFDDGPTAATLHVENGSHLISAPLAIPADGLLSSISNVASTLTLQGAISGDGGLSKSGAGTLILTAANSYAGLTSIGSGTLQIGAGGTTGLVAGPISNSGTLRINRSDAFLQDKEISGSGALDFAGTGTTTITAANTLSGSTTVSSGAVVLSHNLALQNSTLTLSATGGSVNIFEDYTTVTLGGLAGNGPFPLANSIGTSLNLTIGQNNANTSYSGSSTDIGNSLNKVGTGTLSLSGTNTFNGVTGITTGVLSLDSGADFTTAAINTINTIAASAKFRLNGGTLHSSSALIDNASAGIEITGGTATFSGSISNPANIASGNCFINVTGGTLNAGSISLSRSGVPAITSEPATGSATNGLYINGGTVNISGSLVIGNNANSNVNTRLDNGNLTVNGATTLAINNTDRWSILDIAGGTFTSTDTTTGVRLGGTTAGNVIMQARGGLVQAERFQFGQPDLGGSAILNLTAGNLYVGSGGMVLGSTGISAHLRLGGGVLGATADSTSTVPVSITGSAVVTGADSLDSPHSVTFSGNMDGGGSLTKNGSGTVSFTSAGNSFSGAVTVNSGTLGMGGQIGAVTVAPTSTLIPYGTLTAQTASAVNGTLAIRYDVPASLQPGHLHSQDVLTLGAGSALNISGTGTLTAPFYTIASGASGVSGTFGTVTGIPSGYALVYNYNDGSGVPVVALKSSSASPYDTWASSYGLTDASAATTADPDNDGLKNLMEFALGQNPTVSGTGPTLGRSGNFLTLTFDHIAGGNLIFTIEASSSLNGTWSTVQTYPTFGSAGTTVYTDNVAVGTTNRRFIRLAVAVSN